MARKPGGNNRNNSVDRSEYTSRQPDDRDVNLYTRVLNNLRADIKEISEDPARSEELNNKLQFEKALREAIVDLKKHEQKHPEVDQSRFPMMKKLIGGVHKELVHPFISGTGTLEDTLELAKVLKEGLYDMWKAFKEGATGNTKEKKVEDWHLGKDILVQGLQQINQTITRHEKEYKQEAARNAAKREMEKSGAKQADISDSIKPSSHRENHNNSHANNSGPPGRGNPNPVPHR